MPKMSEYKLLVRAAKLTIKTKRGTHILIKIQL